MPPRPLFDFGSCSCPLTQGLDRLGRFLAERLDAPRPGSEPYTHANVAALRRVLEPGDVLLIDQRTAHP